MLESVLPKRISYLFIGFLTAFCVNTPSHSRLLYSTADKGDPFTCLPNSALQNPIESLAIRFRLANLVLIGRFSDTRKSPDNPQEYHGRVTVSCFLKGYTFRTELQVQKFGKPKEYCIEGVTDIVEGHLLYLFFLRRSSNDLPDVFHVLPHGAYLYEGVAMDMMALCDPQVVTVAKEDACLELAANHDLCSLNTNDTSLEIPEIYLNFNEPPVEEIRKSPVLQRSPLSIKGDAETAKGNRSQFSENNMKSLKFKLLGNTFVSNSLLILLCNILILVFH